MILGVVIAYLCVVLAVGLLGHRLFRGTGEDFFLASRTIGPFVLFMTLFGTNMTAFTMLGASGQAHREGIEVFALMGSSTALCAPLIFFFLGIRLWKHGKAQGFITQVQYFRARYESGWLGLLLFIVLVLLMIPYVLIGIKGGGDALHAITGGSGEGLPSWVGSALICGVVFVYVTFGGMRSTAWVNTLQTLIFMIVGALAFVVIVRSYGGFGEAMEQVREASRDHVMRGQRITEPGAWTDWANMASFLLLPLSIGVFPHLFGHWLSAKSASSFKTTIVLYPLCTALVWVPSVVLGTIAVIKYGDYDAAVNGPILVRLILDNAGGVLAGCLAAGVFAAIMSSLDSQTLAVGTMFTQDIVRYYSRDQISERKQVLIGRVFVVGLLLLALVLSLITDQSIFSLGVWTLTGYAGLFPILVAAVYWKRSTRVGVMAAIVTVAMLWGYCYLLRTDKLLEGWRAQWLSDLFTEARLLPVSVVFAGSVVALVVGSLASRPPSGATLDRFFEMGAQNTD